MRLSETVSRNPDEPTEDAILEEALTPPASREKAMGFFDHLEELRWTLIKCAVAYVTFAVTIGIFLRQFFDVLLWPLHYVAAANASATMDLGTMSIMEPFTVIITMCCAGALLPSTPFFLFFIGQFVAPALTEKETRMVLPMCIAAFILFVIGSLFSFFLLVPSTLRVSVELNEFFGFAMRWTPGSYFSLVTWLVLGVGAAFEFPLVILLLVYMGLLSVATLRKYRRHAIVVIFVLAAIITPTPDPLTQCIFAAPLYLLFEIAVMIGAAVEKRRQIAP